MTHDASRAPRQVRHHPAQVAALARPRPMTSVTQWPGTALAHLMLKPTLLFLAKRLDLGGWW